MTDASFTEEYLRCVRSVQKMVYPPDAWGIVAEVFHALGNPILGRG